MDLDQFRERIGLVTQDTQLFSGTIRENLKFVKPDATDEDCLDVLHRRPRTRCCSERTQARHRDRRRRDEDLGWRKQRLSIARALLRRPQLLVFDEATSALDSLTEEEIGRTMREVSVTSNVITVMIAHRLSTIMHADRIYVLERGRIAETGRHELVDAKGLYYAMWRQQVGERREGGGNGAASAGGETRAWQHWREPRCGERWRAVARLPIHRGSRFLSYSANRLAAVSRVIRRRSAARRRARSSTAWNFGSERTGANRSDSKSSAVMPFGARVCTIHPHRGLGRIANIGKVRGQIFESQDVREGRIGESVGRGVSLGESMMLTASPARPAARRHNARRPACGPRSASAHSAPRPPRMRARAHHAFARASSGASPRAAAADLAASSYRRSQKGDHRQRDPT